MIYYSVPFDVDKNIGVYYNKFMSLLEDTDFACFVDGDTTFTTPFYGRQIEDAVKRNPDCGLFYAVTNRIGCPWQVAPESNWQSDDMVYHRRLGEELCEKYGSQVREIKTEPVHASGFLILVQKRVWEAVGGFRPTGMIGVDNEFYRQAKEIGFKINLMPGVYLYHWYRGGDMKEKAHLLPPTDRTRS